MKKFYMFFVVMFFAVGAFANTLSKIASFEVGNFPRGIAIADFNGDGRNEVAVVNFGAGTLIGQNTTVQPESSISIYKEDGTKVALTAGKAPRGAAAGDFNDDGKSDLVVSNYDDGNIMTFVQENGNLVMTDTLSVGNHPVGVTTGDFDKNGRTDIAVAVYSDNKVVIFLNQLKGGWEKVDFPVEGSPTDVVFGTINDIPVLVSANYTAGTVSVMKMEAGLVKKVQEIASGGGVCKVEVADVTGDGINDIIAANFFDNSIAVIKGLTNGTFEDKAEIIKLAGERPNGLAVGDINGDTLLDVVTANRDSDSIDVLVQKSGKLELVKTFVATKDDTKTYGPVEVVCGDVNNDGMTDIAFTHMRTNTFKVIYQELPASPEISSTTHPDQNSWYADWAPVLNMTATDDLTGVESFAYTLAKNESDFSKASAKVTTESSVKFTGLETGTWYFSAVAKDIAGHTSLKPTIFKINITTDMNEKNVYNYPNPVTGAETTIRFPSTGNEDVRIEIKDSVSNKLVWKKVISKENLVKGVNTVKWELKNDLGANISNGTYICTVISGKKAISKPISIIR